MEMYFKHPRGNAIKNPTHNTLASAKYESPAEPRPRSRINSCVPCFCFTVVFMEAEST
mgnify:CR=1 FL=1